MHSQFIMLSDSQTLQQKAKEIWRNWYGTMGTGTAASAVAMATECLLQSRHKQSNVCTEQRP